ncbi:DNA internalization-related competence protein ComEC/Rec2 [Anaerostipes sp.]|uniref:DNA internalization-related competence protein ComEC/Rec2 n=1 Tax=Anaerostipes sp. TaxID=1872530 RepID=UPI0025B8EC2B|nr:DNA internalization-related competence protein ComEC/Rec2 [Anaerostipes sp.]MBS7009788.1 DNA internalization-related competence protein ComEC/Rec2 [Anaerostipes sp.]
MNRRPFLAVFAGCWLGEFTACNNVWMVFAALLFPGILVLFFRYRATVGRSAVLFVLTGFLLGGPAFACQDQRIKGQEAALEGGQQLKAAGTVEWKGKTKTKEYLLVSHVFLPDQKLYLDGDIMVYDNDFDGTVPGNKILLSGKLSAYEKPTNLGENDMRVYYLSRNIEFSMFPEDLKITDRQKNIWKNALLSARNQLADNLSSQYSADILSIFQAMILGDKTGISDDTKDAFTQSGIVHILAISGLHISLAGRGIYRRLRKAGTPFYISGALGLLFAFSYCVMTGMSGSPKRALLMFLIFLTAQALGRSYDLLSSGGAAGIFLLLECPFRCADAAFLMSMSAVISAGLYGEIFRGEKKKTNWEKQKSRLVFCCVIQVIMMPVLLYFQYECYPYSFLFNFFILPLAAAGFTAGFFSAFLPIVLFSAPASGLFSLILFVTRLAEHVPFGSVVFGKPSFLWILVFYLELFFVSQGIKKKPLRRYAGLLAGACFLVLGLAKEADKISFLDVGQGDCIAVSVNRKDMILVDGGSSSKKNVGRYIIAPYIKSQGYQKISAAVITHLDSDHYSGIQELLSAGMIKRLYLPDVTKDQAYKAIEKEAQKNHVPVGYLSRGSKFSGRDWSMECLHPDPDEKLEKNAASLVFRLEVRRFSVLLTGDLEKEGEELLVQKGLETADVLKAGHHGSKNGTREPLLDQLKPGIAVISAGRNNRYGHPHQETVKRLKDSNCMIHETSKEGMLWFSMERKRWYLHSKIDIIKK